MGNSAPDDLKAPTGSDSLTAVAPPAPGMYSKLGLPGVAGVALLLAGVAVVAVENLVVAAGLALIVAGVGLLALGLTRGAMRAIGLR